MSSIIGCLTGVTASEKTRIFNRVKMLLGSPVVGVELRDEQLEQMVCHSIEEYSVHVTDWFLQNQLAEILGVPSEIDLTLKYVANTQYFERSWASSIGEQIGLGANGNRELKTGAISLTANTQDYLIEANREVVEILWFTPSFINLFGLDPFANTNIAFSEFGASFAGHTLYHVMPVFDTIMTAQAAEMRNRVRGHEYSYSLHPGPDGTKRLRLYPVPRNTSTAGSSVGIGGGAGTPGTCYYRYYDRTAGEGNPEYSGMTANPGYSASTSTEQGNGLVSSFADAGFYNLNYDQLNDKSKKWVLDYTFALAARTLGPMIRGKFDGQLPIPDAELRLNSNTLLDISNREMDRLYKKLEDELERLSFRKIMEDRASIQENLNKSQSFGPLDIWIY